MSNHVQWAHMPGVHCHTRPASTSGFAFVYFTAQYCCEQQGELPSEDLIELQAQKKYKRRKEEVTEEPKRFMTPEMARVFSLSEEALLSFWDPAPKCRLVHKDCSSHSERQSSVTVLSMVRKKKSYCPDITGLSGLFFQESRWNWIQQGSRTCTISVRHEWNCSLPSVSYCWRSFSSAISHLPSLLQTVTLLARPLDASPCVPAIVLYYCTFQGTAL